jgi:hypothetical protein
MKGKLFLLLTLVLLLAGASYLVASGCEGDYRGRTNCHFITDENGEGRFQACGSGTCIVNRYTYRSDPPPNIYELCNCR